MRGVVRATVVVATALPALVVARIAAAARSDAAAARLRRWCADVPGVSLLVTGLAWLLVLWGGALYPLLGSGAPQESWGGPSLAGAWAVHVAIAAAALLVVAFAFAWPARPPEERVPSPHPAR